MKILKKIAVITCILTTISTVCIAQKSKTYYELDSLAKIYLLNQDLDSALFFCNKALLRAEKEFGKKDSNYTNSLLFLLELHLKNENYKEAIKLATNAELSIKEIYGENHEYYTTAIVYLGIINKEIGNYKLAIEYYLKAIELDKKNAGITSAKYAMSLNNLADVYQSVGNYPEAEQLSKQALSILDSLGENNTFDYSIILNGLAILYMDLGNYAFAEPLFIKSKNIRKNIFGDKHLDYAETLNSLASLYSFMGNYKAAEELFLETLSIIDTVVGRNSQYYAGTINNLASVYYQKMDYTKSEEYMKIGLEINKNILGPKHPYTIISIANVALLLNKMEKFTESETYFIEAIELYKEVIGINQPYYAAAMGNLGILYSDMGAYNKAEKFQLEALEIRKKILGMKHPHYAVSINSLAQLYYKMGRFDLAEKYFVEGIGIINNNILNNFKILSEEEQALYLSSHYKDFNNFYIFCEKRKAINPEIIGDLYNMVTRNKGLMLKSSTAMRIAILNSKDSLLIKKYNKWISQRKELDLIYQNEISKKEKKVKQLEQISNSLEKELVSSSQILSNFEKNQQITWQNVQANLRQDEAIIEFIHYDFGKENDSTVYAAIVLTSKMQFPELIRLCTEKQLIEIFNQFRTDDKSKIHNIYSDTINKGNSLYNLLWKPIEEYLKDVKTIYYSPDGILHKLSFAAICKKKNVLLSDNYILQHQNATLNNEVKNIEFNLSKNIVGIFGGIDYNSDTTSFELWDYLPGTKDEINKINRILSASEITIYQKTGRDAKESDFKFLAPQCNVLHIATHGFFYPSIETINYSFDEQNTESLFSMVNRSSGYGVWQFAQNKNPLMRSGLAFSNANNVWNQRFPNSDEDGVLTANEVSNLNLQNTQLVVLSACETGLGDIKGSEGVYGLQRAFKMAGVKYIIMSLWQVPDKETVEFMTTFYSKLLKQKDIRKAFSETQNEMRKKYDSYYWAAFVLIE